MRDLLSAPRWMLPPCRADAPIAILVSLLAMALAAPPRMEPDA